MTEFKNTKRDRQIKDFRRLANLESGDSLEKVHENTHRPKVTLAIANFNISPEYVEKCLRSVFAQTLENLEILIIDNCSTNSDSIEKIRELVAEFEKSKSKLLPFWKLRLIENSKNLGLNGSRQIAVSEATGDYIGFIDSDDWIEPNYSKTLVDLAIEKNADMVVCAFWNEWQNFQKVTVKSEKIVEFAGEAAIQDFCYNLRSLISVYPWGRLYRTSILRQNSWKPYDKLRDGTDIFCNLEFLSRSKNAVYLPTALYHYRMRRGGIAKNDNIKSYPREKEFFSAWKKLFKTNHNLRGKFRFTRIIYALNILLLAVQNDDKRSFHRAREVFFKWRGFLFFAEKSKVLPTLTRLLALSTCFLPFAIYRALFGNAVLKNISQFEVKKSNQKTKNLIKFD